MPVLELRNEHCAVELRPDRGGEVSGFRVGRGTNLLFYEDWRSPLSAGDGPAYGSTELDWLSRYSGGWQVLFPNAGAESVVDGVPVAFHGETSLAHLEVTTLTADRCELRAVARLPLESERRIALLPDRPGLRIDETVTNLGSRPVDFLWGHHPVFPALPESTIELPGAPTVTVEPATPGPLDPGTSVWPWAHRADGLREDLRRLPGEEQVRLLYLHDLEEPWAVLRPPPGQDRPALALAWDGDAFPNLWVWLQNGDPGFPWYGRGRMLGLEPQRSRSFDGLAPAIARGQAVRLEPGASVSAWVALVAFEHTAGPVRSVDRAGRIAHRARRT